MNPEILKAVEDSNANCNSSLGWNVFIPPDLMIPQSADFVMQNVHHYFDGVSKLALASQPCLMKGEVKPEGADTDGGIERLIAEMREQTERAYRIVEEMTRSSDTSAGDAGMPRDPSAHRPGS